MPRCCSTNLTRSVTRGSQADGCPGADDRSVQPAMPAADATRATTIPSTAHRRRRRGGAAGGSVGAGSGQAVSHPEGATTVSTGVDSMVHTIDRPAGQPERGEPESAEDEEK